MDEKERTTREAALDAWEAALHQKEQTLAQQEQTLCKARKEALYDKIRVPLPVLDTIIALCLAAIVLCLFLGAR